jgi:hypothetical protein
VGVFPVLCSSSTRVGTDAVGDGEFAPKVKVGVCVVEAPNVNAVEVPPNRGVEIDDVELFWLCLETSGGEGELENMESDLSLRPVVPEDNI